MESLRHIWLVPSIIHFLFLCHCSSTDLDGANFLLVGQDASTDHIIDLEESIKPDKLVSRKKRASRKHGRNRW